MIGMTQLATFPVFETRPSDDYISRWHEHIQSTGYPETFEDVSTTRPEGEVDDLVLLSGETRVPIIRREGQQRVPCPYCRAESPKFANGRMAWFPAEKAVRFIGPVCAKRHLGEVYTEADLRYRQEGTIVRMQMRWQELRRHSALFTAFFDRIEEQAKALQDLRIAISRKAPGLWRTMHRELSADSGNLTSIVVTGAKDRFGNAEFERVSLGYVQGLPFWKPGFAPYNQILQLRHIVADLDMPLPTWARGSDDVDAEKVILARTKQADKIPERLDALVSDILFAQQFFTDENFELLERWVNVGSSFFATLRCKFKGPNFTMSVQSAEGSHFIWTEVNPTAFIPVPLVTSEILELRRPMIRNG